MQKIEKLKKNLKKPTDVIVYKMKCATDSEHKGLCFNKKDLVCEECSGELDVIDPKIVPASVFARKLKEAKEREKEKKAIEMAKRNAKKAISRK